MPRRGEETSPAPRRSPRAAVKASASPSPIIRGSRSRSTSKQTTPKTRVASPSPKRRASSKNTKTEKDETPKQSGRAAKKVADKGKKSPASAKTPSTSGKSRSRGRQQKNVKEESEDGGEEEDKEEETKPSPPKSGSRAGRAKTAEPKKERAVPTRKGRVQVKEESEEEVDEVEKSKSEDKKLPEKSGTEQVDDGGGGERTTARSRRSTSKQPEEVAATEEQSAPMARTARSRSRGQGKKAEDKLLTESLAVTESRSGRGRRSAGQTIVDEPKPSKDESVVQEGEESEEVPKESLDTLDKDNTLKGRKRGNVDVERSPEKSPSSKRQRKLDGSSNESDILEPAPVQDEVSVSLSKVKSSVITPKEMQEKGVTKQSDEVAKSETMEVDDKEAEVISRTSPKASPAKQAPGSPHGKKESLSSAQENRNQSKVPLITVQDANDLTGTKSSLKSLDTIDSSKSSIASNISPNKVSEIELSKSPKSSVDKELMKSPVLSPVALEVTKSPVRSPAAPEVAKSPVRSPAALEVAKSPVRSPAVPEVAKSPVRSPAAPEVAKSPVRSPAAPEVAKPPVRSPAAPEVAKPPVRSPAAPEVAKSPVRSPAAPEVAKSPVRSPAAPEVAKSPVRSPAAPEVAKPPVRSPAAPEVAKPPIRSPAAPEVAKSPAVADVAKSPTAALSASSVVLEASRSPAKPAVGETSVSPNVDMAKSPMSVDASNSPVEKVLTSAVKSPITAEISKSPVKSPLDEKMVASDVKSPAVEINKSPVKSPMVAEAVKSPVQSLLGSEVTKSPVKSQIVADPQKTPLSFGVSKSPVKVELVKSPSKISVMSPEAMDVSESSAGISVEMQSPKKSPEPSKSPAKSPIIAMDVSRSPLGLSMTTDTSKSPVKSPMASETLKSPIKSSLDMEISRSPVKSPVSMGPSKLATTVNVLKSPIDLTKCSKPLSETVKSPVKTPPRESLQTSESTKLSGHTDIPLSSSLLAKTSNVHNVTPSAATVDVKPVSAAVTGPLKDRDQTQKSLLSETSISSVSGMSTKSPLPSVATASPTSQILGSSPVKSFPTTQTAASISPLGVHSSISKPTPADSPVTPPKPSPPLSTRSPVISGMGISPSKPLTQPFGILESSHSQNKEAISVTSCPVMPSSKSESLLSSSKQSSSQGSSVSPSKSPSSLETGRPSVYLSPTHQSLLQSIDKTVTPSKQPLLIQSATQSSTNQPVVQSPNHSPKPLAAPNSNLPLPSKEQDITPLPTSKPVGSSPSLSPVKTPIVQGTNLPQPVIQSTNISQSVSLEINVSPVPGLHQSLVKSPIKTVSPEKLSTGSTSPSKPVNPLSPPGVLQKKPETLSPGHLNLTSPANKPLFVPTSPVKTSISPAVGSSLQAKPFSSQSSTSPLKPVGHTEKSTWSSPPKLDTPVSSTSPTKVNVTTESGSSPSKPTVVPSSGGSPTKSPSVPVGQLGTHSPTSKIIPSLVPPKSQQPFIQETKISSSQPAVTISGTKPQITHITGSVSSKPLVTHMTGVVPQKSTNPQSSVLTSMKPSSISPNKSQVSPGFSTTAKPTIGQGCSKPSIIPSAVTTLSKPQGHHESSGVSSKPLQTLGPTTLPSRPQVTHMAGVAVHSRPQVTHMSGIATSSKSQTGPSSDINPHPKPPVVHVTGSAIPKSPGTISTGFSPSVAVSPPKTLHSSATFQSAAPASSANMSSLSSSPFLSKCPSVPVTSAATGRPTVPPSSSVEGGGIQSVSPLKHTLQSSNIVSAQVQAQPDSSHGQLLSNISLQTTPPSLTIASNIQSSQSLHPQKNISPTKPAFIPGILNKVTQLSSTSGQPIDPKAQLSISNVKAPNSSSSTPSAMSLFTTESKTPMETQSKVPIQVKPNLQATIPVISSTATVPSSKTVSSTLISGSPSSPIISKVVGVAQPKVADSKAQSTGTVSMSPLPTVGSIQQVGTIPSTGLTSQPADSLLASSTSSEGGVINGAGAKASSVQVQPSTEANKKRKMDSDQPNEESPESKKARVSPDDPKSLISNGSKDASRVNQASKISQDQSATKTEVMDIDPSPSTKQDSNGNEVSLKDYVIIDKSEVPHKDSLEVKESLPKMPLSKPTPAQSVSLSSSQNPESSSSACSSSGYVGSSAGSTNFKDVLLNRTFKLNPTLFSSTITEKSKQFSVVTYNILADCHFRTNNKMDRYSAEEKPYILLPGRHKRLMAELCYVDADIVCLQEVEPEYYSKTLSPDMQKLGYEGFFKKRVHENFDEGETTFYKTSRFSDPENTAYSLKQLIDKDIQELSLSEDVKESVRKFMCRPDVLLVTRLRCKNTGKFITVGNIHVNWGQFKLPNLQCVQIARAIREVVNRAGNDSSPHVICGDFNSFPQAPGYQLASEGYLSDSMIHILQSSKTMEMPDGTKSALIDHLWQGFQHTSSSLKSAYAVVQGQEPELTSLTTNTRTCLDYVFYSSSSLEAVGVLQVPDKQIVLDCKFIPNKIFPSDHLSLKAVLAFK